MTKYTKKILNLLPEVITKIEQLAIENNSTFDNIVNEIIIEVKSKIKTIEEFKEILLKKDYQEIASYYIIVDQNKNKIARIAPYR